jgi:tetratricopeptide (TPR) repeat protein
LQEADAIYKQLLAMSFDPPTVLHNLGTVALGLDDPDQAIAYYEQALALRPDYLQARFQLASAYKFNGRYEEAYAAFQQAAALAAADPQERSLRIEALYQLADLELLRGHAEQAERLLAQFLEIVPDHPAAHYTRAQALVQLGRAAEAEAELGAHMRLRSQRQPTSPAAAAR